MELSHGTLEDRQHLERRRALKIPKRRPKDAYADEFKWDQNDGVDWKPTFVTSFSPRAGDQCRSWLPLGCEIIGVQGPGEMVPETANYMERMPTTRRGRPLQRISDLIQLGRQKSDIVCVINDDIQIETDLQYWRTLVKKAAYALVCVQRLELPDKVRDSLGIDMFLVPPTLNLPDDNRFLMGECGWDWWLPILARHQGIQIAFAMKPIALHTQHKRNWDLESYRDSCKYLRESFGIDNQNVTKRQIMTSSEWI